MFAVAPQTETCLAIPASGGSIPAQVTCVDSMNHLWNFTQIDVGLYHIASLGSAGNCLAGSGSSVFLTSCFYGAAGQWRLTGRGNTFRVANASGGGCLNRSGATDVVLGTCGTNSLWQLLY